MKLAPRVQGESSDMSVWRGSEKGFILLEWSWNNTNGGRKKKITHKKKKELPCKSGMAWRRNPVTRVRTDWFHVRLLNSISVCRRHWPTVEGCTSQQSCWVTSSTCDWRPLPQGGAPPWPIHLMVELRTVCVGTSCLRKLLPAPTMGRVREGKEHYYFFSWCYVKNAPNIPSWALKMRFSGELCGLLRSGAVRRGSCCCGPMKRRLFL